MKETDAAYFAKTLASSKTTIDEVIQDYWSQELQDTQANYGDASLHALSAFASIMDRGGKRIRAALSEVAYRMFGGTDPAVIQGMGLALEMIHAYLLVIDDICDRSELRRGGPTAHRVVEKWHREAGLHGDSEHFGTSLATLAAMTGMHEAMLEITKLPISADRRLEALDNVNRFLVITSHGQFNDLMNEANTTRDRKRIEDVLLWKTAYYTFANPLQFGAILAGAPAKSLDALMDYSLAAGRAFQISDDIIGIFGSPTDTGKIPSDDIKEGKRTILTAKALELAAPADASFLESQLGNPDLTDEAFARCQQIISGSSALSYAQSELAASCQKAIECADNADLPSGDGVRFLRGLADYLRDRKS